MIPEEVGRKVLALLARSGCSGGRAFRVRRRRLRHRRLQWRSPDVCAGRTIAGEHGGRRCVPLGIASAPGRPWARWFSRLPARVDLRSVAELAIGFAPTEECTATSVRKRSLQPRVFREGSWNCAARLPTSSGTRHPNGGETGESCGWCRGKTVSASSRILRGWSSGPEAKAGRPAVPRHCPHPSRTGAAGRSTIDASAVCCRGRRPPGS